MDCHGNTVQERIEQAMEEINTSLANIEKRGRVNSMGESSTAMHTLEPASMLRQVSVYTSMFNKGLHRRVSLAERRFFLC